MEIKLLYITVKNNIEAKYIATESINCGLAICGNIFDEVESIYKWNNEIKCNKESVLILKYASSNSNKLIQKIKSIHSYDIPCILVLPLEGANKDFIEWAKCIV